MGRKRSSSSIVLDLAGRDTTTWQGEVLISNVPRTLKAYESRFMLDDVTTSAMRHGLAAALVDVGNPLDSVKVEVDYPICGTGAGSGPSNGVGRNYVGPVIAWPHHVPTSWQTEAQLLSVVPVDHVDTRYALGATAISRCKPASPEAALGVALSEALYDGIPSAYGRLDFSRPIEYFRTLGRNYLNVEFGWKPFISDVRQTGKVLQDQADILEKLKAHSGQPIRRRYQFPIVQTSTSAGDGYLPWPTLDVYHWTQGGHTVKSVYTKKTWFSGEFRYKFPSGADSAIETLRAHSRQLVGIDWTPETLWQARPWTWMVDWFSNSGDFMSNLSAIAYDHLVMHYGYLMQETKMEYTSSHYGVKSHKMYGLPPTISGRTSYVHKTRVHATPFGFGFDWDKFTPRQFAILASLGITRGSR